MFSLTVVENFLSHAKGDVITDQKLVKQYLDSEWSAHVIKTEAVDPITKA